MSIDRKIVTLKIVDNTPRVAWSTFNPWSLNKINWRSPFQIYASDDEAQCKESNNGTATSDSDPSE